MHKPYYFEKRNWVHQQLADSRCSLGTASEFLISVKLGASLQLILIRVKTRSHSPARGLYELQEQIWASEYACNCM